MSKEKELNVSEALGFTDDLMFQNVMRDPEICRMFLNEVLPHLDIQDITVRTQERIAFNQEEKVSILDVLITDSRGRRYNVEMQVAHKADMDKRARQYLFKMMEDGFLRRKQEYGELHAAYVIFILPFDPKGKGLKRYIFVYTAKEDPSVELNDDSAIIYLNTKGTKGEIRPELDDLYRMIEGKPTSNGKLVSRIKKSMNNYRRTEEWRQHVMNTEEVAEAAKQQGMHEATVVAIHKTINMLRRMKRSPKQILQELEQDYGNEFSEEELADFVKNA